MLPQNTTTIEDFIDAGRNTNVTYFDMSFRNMMENGTWVSIKNAVSDYIQELSNVSVSVKLSEEDQKAYFYKPKLLCYDVYGNPELYYVILLLNDMADVKEFTKPIIKMLSKEYMSLVMGYIYDAEREAMESYNDTWDN